MSGFVMSMSDPTPPAQHHLGAAEAVGLAERKLTHDPLRDAIETGGVTGALRRAVLQAMRPYTHHQDELNGAVVGALREITHLLDDMRLLLEGARARPAYAHPAISQTDEHGGCVLRFEGASCDEATYRGFEDIFRGDERTLRERQQSYAAAFAGCEWVLDLGCGRGEFLEALGDAGLDARGVDLDESMVARCREKGLAVESADVFSYLRGLEDHVVPAMFTAQVVEHLNADQLRELVALMQAKLVPGGLAIIETVNPHNPTALKAFWTDPTHHHPLFPEVLLGLCRLAGFESGEVRFPTQTGRFDTDIYTSPDYAIHARTR